LKKTRFFSSPAGEIALCDRCAGEVYPGDLVHFIDGFIICPECFSDFAFDYFADRMFCGREIKEMLRSDDT